MKKDTKKKLTMKETQKEAKTKKDKYRKKPR